MVSRVEEQLFFSLTPVSLAVTAGSVHLFGDDHEGALVVSYHELPSLTISYFSPIVQMFDINISIVYVMVYNIY